MLDLTKAICANNDEKVRHLVKQHPELINAVYRSKRSLDWALQHGNFISYATLLRVGAKGTHDAIDNRELLGRYIYQICHNYFRSGWLEDIESSIWGQVFQGNSYFYVEADNDQGMSDGEKEDIKFLLKVCHITTEEEFVGFGAAI